MTRTSGGEDANRELAREIRNEAQKLARDYRIQKVQFLGCDVSLDGLYIEVKYEADGDSELKTCRTRWFGGPLRRPGGAPPIYVYRAGGRCGRLRHLWTSAVLRGLERGSEHGAG